MVPPVVLHLLRVSKREGYKELHFCLPTVTQLCKASPGSDHADPMPVLMTLCLSFTLSRLGSQETTPSLQAQEQIDLHCLIQIAASQVKLNRHSELRHWNQDHWITEICSTGHYLVVFSPLTTYKTNFSHPIHLISTQLLICTNVAEGKPTTG